MIEFLKGRDAADAGAAKPALEILTPDQRARFEKLEGKKIELRWPYDELVPEDAASWLDRRGEPVGGGGFGRFPGIVASRFDYGTHRAACPRKRGHGTPPGNFNASATSRNGMNSVLREAQPPSSAATLSK